MTHRPPRPPSLLSVLALAGALGTAPATAEPLRIEASDGGTLRLGSVTNITPQRGSPIEIVAAGGGSRVELPALATLGSANAATGSYVQAADGGVIVLADTTVALNGGTELRLTETGVLTLGALRLENGAVLSGSGFLGVAVTNNGRVSPGAGPGAAGAIRVGGTYQQGAAGVLAIELGGTAPGDQFDRLTVDQTAQLGGTLAVSGFGGFVPAEGAGFTVLAAQARTGQFAQTTGLQWESGGTLALSYSATGASLTAQGPGFGDGAGPTLTALKFAGLPLASGAELTTPGEFSLTATDLSGVARVEFRIDGTLLGTAPAPAGGNGETGVWLDLGTVSDGPHTLEVQGFDTAGNDTRVALEIRITLAPPAPPVLSAPPSGLLTIQPQVAVAGHAERGTQVILSRDDQPVGDPLAVDPSGAFAGTVALALGENHIQAAARNRAGTSALGPGARVTRQSPVALQVQSVGIPPLGSPGKPVQVAWQVRNTGDAATSGPWTDEIVLSANAVIGDADDRGLGTAGFPAGESLAAGAVYDRALVYTLPADLPDGDYWVGVRADAGDRVGAPAADKERISDHPITIRPHGPDLVVTQVVPPVDGVLSGATTEVTFVVKNQGDEAAEVSQWVDTVYLSADTELMFRLADEDLRGSFPSIRTLRPGEEYRQTVSLKLPQDQIGTFYLAAYADGTHHLGFPGLLAETDESNNVGYSPAFRIDPAPQPDLIASAITAQPNPIFSGQYLYIRWTTTNQGDGPSDPYREGDTEYPWTSHWRTDVYLSPTSDPSIDPDRDIRLQYYSRINAPLAAQAAEGGSIRDHVPVDIHGPYFIKVQLDTFNQITEMGGESNNVAVSSSPLEVILSVPVDLVPTAVSGPTTGVPGHLMRVTWSAENAGPRPDFYFSWTDAVYLSQDDQLDATDIRLGEDEHSIPRPSPGSGSAESRPDLQPYTRAQDFRVPNDTPAGTYRLLISADDGNDIFELPEGETNNVLAAADPVEIVLLPTDLSPEADTDPDHPLPASGAPGTPIDLHWRVTNTGSIATAVTDWRDAVLLSPTPTLEGRPLVTLGEFSHRGVLDAGAGYDLSRTATVPYVTPGDYYLLFSTDTDNAVYELAPGEDNNLLAVPFRVSSEVADLAVKQVTAPAAGNQVQVEWTVVNQGAKPTSAAAWTDEVYLSRDKTLDATDILLGTADHGGTLAPDGSYTQGGNYPLPVQDAGLYYLIVHADAQGDVFETERANNLAVVPLLVNISPADQPNLRPANLVAPTRINAGQALDLSWTERNIGGGTTDETHWTVGVYLSADRYLDRGGPGVTGRDLYLGSIETDHALAPGEGLPVSASLRLPSGLTGSYYLLVYSDLTNAVYEGNETDNLAIAPHPVEVVAPPISDLTIGEITPPETATAGEDATFSYEVINAGTEPLTGSWEDSLYLSADDQWDIDDTRIGSFKTPLIHLQPGESRTIPVIAPVPGVLPGDYHVIVRGDIFGQMPETDETNNVATSAALVRTDVTPLQLGVPLDGALPVNRNHYLALSTPADQTIEITLDSVSPQHAPYLYAAFEGIPGPGQYEFASEAVQADRQRVLIPASQAGTYYLSLDPEPLSKVVGGQVHYRIEAKALPFGISKVSPSTVGSGLVTLRAQGSLFDLAATRFWLEDAASGEHVAPQESQVVSPAEALLFFDLTGLTNKSLRLIAQTGGQLASSPALLQIEPPRSSVAGLPLIIKAEIQPTAFRAGVERKVAMTLENQSNIDAEYVEAIVSLDPSSPAEIRAIEGNTPFIYILNKQTHTLHRKFARIIYRRLAAGEAQTVLVTIYPGTVGGTVLGSDWTLLWYSDGELRDLESQAEAVYRRAALELPSLYQPLGLEEVAHAAAQDDSDWANFWQEFESSLQAVDFHLGGLEDFRRRSLLIPTAGPLSQRSVQGNLLVPAALIRTAARTSGTGEEIDCGPCKPNEVCKFLCDPWLPPCAPDGIDLPCSAFDYAVEGVDKVVGITKPVVPVGKFVCDVHCSKGFQDTWCKVYLGMAGASVNPDGKCRKDQVNNAGDPNEKTGPSTARWSSSTDPSVLRYRIYFENVGSASAPAAEITISDRIDSSIDVRSFRLGDFNLGGTTFPALSGLARYSGGLVWSGGKDLLLGLTGGVDASTGEAFWRFKTIDQKTGEVVNDPALGLLPPEDGTGRGQGWVEFSVKPKAGVPVGTQIPNKATITFDYEEPIVTNEWVTTITAPPVPVTPATMTVTPVTQRNTTEAGLAARFEVVLDQAPTGTVTVPLVSGDPTEGTLSPAELVFTPANWRIPQTATVTGVNDCAPDGNVDYQVLIGPATSTDPAYHGVAPAGLNFTNLDNDPPSSHPTLGVCNYTLISTARYGRFDYDYTYRAELTNAGAAAGSITATLSSTSAKTRVIDGTLNFGAVGAGATVQSQDTFTIRQDRQSPFDPASLRWGFQVGP